MLGDSMVRAAAEHSERRTLLKRATAATAVVYATLLGVKVADSSAYEAHGCHLCYQPNGNDCPGRLCSWCWWGDCHVNSGGSTPHRTHCCEAYYGSSRTCSGACDADCSFFGYNIAC